MQLLSKMATIEKMNQDLKDFIFENQFDSIIGVEQSTQGVFLLLFSHRYNMQKAVIVTGTHDVPKVVNNMRNLLKGAS